MAGRTLQLMEFRDFDLSDLKTSGFTRFYPAQNIPVRGYRNGVLIWRFRSLDVAAAGSIDLSLVATAPTVEDPSRFYRDFNNAFPKTGSIVVSGPASGSALLYSAALTTDAVPLPDYLSLRVIVFQTSVGAALKFTMSVDLVLKE